MSAKEKKTREDAAEVATLITKYATTLSTKEDIRNALLKKDIDPSKVYNSDARVDYMRQAAAIALARQEKYNNDHIKIQTRKDKITEHERAV